MEFKGTKGEWEICEHSWSDTSILCDGKTICTQSIYSEATEETQEQLENEVSANFKLISKAPEMFEMLIKMKSAMLELMQHQEGLEEDFYELNQLITEATTI